MKESDYYQQHVFLFKLSLDTDIKYLLIICLPVNAFQTTKLFKIRSWNYTLTLWLNNYIFLKRKTDCACCIFDVWTPSFIPLKLDVNHNAWTLHIHQQTCRLNWGRSSCWHCTSFITLAMALTVQTRQVKYQIARTMGLATWSSRGYFPFINIHIWAS